MLNTSAIPKVMSKQRYDSLSTMSSTDVSEIYQSDIEASISSLSLSDDVTNLSYLKVRKQGKEPKTFKPLLPNSLYAKIINKPADIMVHIEEWSNLFVNSVPIAISQLLQLFVDLMGIQEFKIVNFYADRNTDFAGIEKQMTSKLRQSKRRARWVFQLKSTFSKDLWLVVKIFLGELIKNCNSCEILYAPVFYENIIGFFSETIKSDTRCIRYNALLIGFKLCTELLKIVNKVEQNIVNKLLASTSSSSSSSISDKAKYSVLTKMVHVFIDATKEHARFEDTLLDVLYPICIEEVAKWIYFSSQFVLKKFEPKILLSFLNFHLEYDNILVRIASVKAFTLILQTDDIVDVITEKPFLFKNYMNNVAKKFNDIDTRVRAFAFYFYAVCVNRYPDAITKDLRNDIISHLVAKDQNLYKASGFFFTQFLNKVNRKLELVKFIINLSHYENFTNKMGLMVESMIFYYQDFKEYEWLLEMITDDSIETMFEESSDIECLIEFAYHILHNAIFDKSELTRKETPRDHDIDYKKNEVTKDLIPIIPKLFDKYSNNIKAMQFILKMALLINFTSDGLMSIHEDIESIMETIFVCTESGDKPLISAISKLLSKITDKNCPLTKDCSMFCNVFITATLIRCRKFYLNFTKATIISESDMKLLNQFSIDLAILASLSENYDFTSGIDWALVYTDFNVLNNESAFNIKITLNQITLCSNYLKWTVKKMAENKGTRDKVVKIQISNFYVKLLDMIDSVQCDNFKSLIFANLAQLSQDLGVIIIKHQQLKDFQYQTTAEGDMMIRTFIIRHCFCTDDLSIEQEETFENFIRFAFSGYVDVADLKYMFKYIYKRNEQYTAIFNRIVKMVLDKYGAELISSLILESIFYLATMGPRIDPHFTSQAKELGCAFMKVVPSKIFPHILKMGVNYVRQDKTKWALMQSLTPFTRNLKKIDKIKLTGFVEKSFPKPHHKEVLRFLLFIRVKPLKIQLGEHLLVPATLPSPGTLAVPPIRKKN